MTFTQEQIAQALDALPKENRPVMTAIVGQLQAELENIAKSTVRECADFIAPLGDWCGGHGEPRMPSTGECANKLKEHFGVE